MSNRFYLLIILIISVVSNSHLFVKGLDDVKYGPKDNSASAIDAWRSKLIEYMSDSNEYERRNKAREVFDVVRA